MHKRLFIVILLLVFVIVTVLIASLVINNKFTKESEQSEPKLQILNDYKSGGNHPVPNQSGIGKQ